MTATHEGRATLKRRRYSQEFKASIILACQDPDVSIAQVARQFNLNANQVQNWIAQARKDGSAPETPHFVSLPLPSSPPKEPPMQTGVMIRIQVPRPSGTVVIEWPSAQASECLALLRGLLS
jgi:transposase